MSNSYTAVIPSYNGARYIASALESILAQTRKFDEIIVSDDNSSDETLIIAKQYESRGVKVVHNPHGPSGFVNGWNNAIKLASSDYISILHQDDFLYPDFLEKMDNALRENPDVLHAFAMCDYADEVGKIVRKPYREPQIVRRYTKDDYIKEYMDCGNNTHIHRCPGVITHQSVFESCSYRECAGHIADDDFFYRVAHHTDVVGVLEPLAAYRLHSASETGKLSDMNLVRRLSRDYLFLLMDSYYRKYVKIDFYRKLCKIHYRVTRRLLGYSLKKMDICNIIYSIYNIVLNKILAWSKL